MGLRFTMEGAEYPAALIDDLVEGQVVFLCGAGVSAPQLPGFEDLVKRVYERVRAEPTGSEIASIAAGRPEEALGALHRRLADNRRIYQAVRELLLPETADLSNHKTLLRLSRSLDNGVALVTTNFDPLFERALDTLEGHGRGRAQSLAGQALPLPGTLDFCGVIHLHGRIADPVSGVGDTPLVLTSSEYGEAYMRAGWTSRFLFDLVRCRTLVLVGYSAGDAPIRYFLNLRESDRDRFPDVRPVYALDVKGDGDPDRWSSVAVEPLFYEQPGPGDHSALWRDLDSLAAMVERPKAWRRAQAQKTLGSRFDVTPEIERHALDWVLRGQRDLWDVVIPTIEDPRWFDHLSAQQLWSDQDAAWVLAAWCSLNWGDRHRLSTALTWHGRLGEPFGQQLALALERLRPTTAPLARTWRLISKDSRSPKRIDHQPFLLAQRLRQPGWTDSDLEHAINALKPRAEVSELWGERKDGIIPEDAQRVWELVSVRFTLEVRGGLTELMNALRELRAASFRILDLGGEALRQTIALAQEADLIAGDWDRLDSGVPTVEAHPQNEHHDGAVLLAEILTHAFAQAANEAPSRARVYAEAWNRFESQIGARLSLSAFRHPGLFNAAEIVSAIINLPEGQFWSIKRELILLMAERLSDASPSDVSLIVDRILGEGPNLYLNLEPTGAVDWRPQVRDREIWLRLTALKRAGVLPDRGRVALVNIAARHSFITGDFEEADLFNSYSSGVRSVQGDPKPLVEAVPEERLELALKQAAEWDPDVQQNWSAYCASDPAGALEALRAAPLTDPNTGLWSQLVGALSWTGGVQDEKARAQRVYLARAIFEHLTEGEEAFLKQLAPRLCELHGALQKVSSAPEGWWDRLWALVEKDEEPVRLDDGTGFLDRLINQPPGKLAEQLLSAISKQRGSTKRLSAIQRNRLRRVLSSNSPAGWYGRGALVRQIGFLHQAAPSATVELLRPYLKLEDDQGRALRSVLVEWSEPGAKATKAFRREILQAAVESQASGEKAVHVASLLVFPIVRQNLYAGQPDWGITSEDVARLTPQVSSSILHGVADCLRRWVTPTDLSPEEAWRRGVAPIFSIIWPTERRFQKSAYSTALAAMCASAGDAFPEALEQVRPYLRPFDQEWPNIHFLTQGNVVSRHPAEVLDLLWLICGPPGR